MITIFHLSYINGNHIIRLSDYVSYLTPLCGHNHDTMKCKSIDCCILEVYGLVTIGQKFSDILRPKECPNCKEFNKPDSNLYAKCRMVLTMMLIQRRWN